MRKFILLMAVMSAALSITAQTGSLVREDRVWNYTIEDTEYGGTVASSDDCGYHFSGTKYADGETYSVYRNGNNDEVALLREAEGKVYLHLDLKLKENILSQKDYVDNFDEIFGADPTEMLLYNFDAKVGESYYMPIFYPDRECFELTQFFVVGLKDVNIRGEMMTFQTVAAGSIGGPQYTIVKGIGANQGMFHRPQLGCLIPGVWYTYAYIKDVRTSEDKELFQRKDFKNNIQTSYVINDYDVWEYNGHNIRDGYFSYKMHFDGVKILDGRLYHIMHTTDGKVTTWHDNPEPGFYTSDIENGLTFLLREEDGRVYLHAPEGGEEEGYSRWTIDDCEALLYDFNAREGDEMTVIGSSGNLLDGKVTSKISVNIDGYDYKGYTILFERPNWEFTVMQGMGNISLGCLPYFIEDLITGEVSEINHAPVDLVRQELQRVTYKSGGVKYERGADGRWPWENVDSVMELEAGSGISFDGGVVSAFGGELTIYDISGKVVAEGRGEVSTAGLQPGVYVARAGGKSLKIIVRD